jgi:spermidine synthase
MLDLKPPSKWFWELLSPDLMLCSSILDMKFAGKTTYQSVEIMRTGSFGWCLVLDGKVQSSDADEFVYHEAIVHLPMITHPDPKTVFIGGGGEGAIAREVLSYPGVERVVMVDIDEKVVEVCRKYLPGRSQGAFEEGRLELHFTDARKYLENTHDRFDVMIFDLADPVEEGPAYLLYTKNFNRLVMERLVPGGIAVTQAGNCNVVLHTEVFTVIHNTMEAVFPEVYPYSAAVPSFAGAWGFVMGSVGPDPCKIDSAEVDRRIAQRTNASLGFYDGIVHEGMLRLPKYLREALRKEDRMITEDTPFFVY